MKGFVNRGVRIRLLGGTLIMIFILVSSSSPVFAEVTVEPHYTHCCLPRTAAHGPIPTSISAMVDDYEIEVTDNRNVSMTGLIVYIPAGFEFITASAGESGWTAKTFVALAGSLSSVVWNGSSILPGTNTTFMLTLRNPDVGWRFSAVYTFLIAQTYVSGSTDASRDPVEIIWPLRVFGIESSVIASTTLAVVLALLLLEAILPSKDRRSMVTSAA